MPRRDDDSDDDRPRRKKKPKTKAGPPTGLIVAGVLALVLVVAGVGGYFLWAKSGKATGGPVAGKGGSAAGGGPADAAAPDGFTLLTDAGAGFRVLLPGVVQPVSVNLGAQNTSRGLDMVRWRSGPEVGGVPPALRGKVPAIPDSQGAFGGQMSVLTMPPELLPAGGADGLAKGLEGVEKLPFMTKTGQTPVTLGGKPGVELRYQADPDRGRGSNPYVVYLAVVSGSKFYVIELQGRDGWPEEATLKTVRESFAFL